MASSSKQVSFESQVKITNNTLYNIKIHKVITPKYEPMLSVKDMEFYREYNMKNIDGIDIEQYDIENEILPNQIFRLPLSWILSQTSIYYECRDGVKFEYRILISNIQDTFIKKKGYGSEKLYNNIRKYHMLEQLNVANIFFGFDINIAPTKPYSRKPPPQFDCVIRSTVRFSNNFFSFLRIYRETDNKLMHSIRPGGYVYMYEPIHSELIKDKNNESQIVNKKS